MKKLIALAVFVALIALIDHGLTVSVPPVTVTLVSPTNGAIVSNTITLSAVASSVMGPITKVEFYRDGVLIKTVYSKPEAPTSVNATK